MKYALDYVTVNNCIPKDICAQLIMKVNQKKWDKHTWEGRQYDIDQVFDVVGGYTDLQMELAPFIEQAFNTYIEKFKIQGGAIENFSAVRFNKYKEGTAMLKHYDHIRSLFDGPKRGVPILSIVGLLNDDFEGGEMIVKDTHFPLKQGDIIIMPSCFIYPHEITTVTKGTRYSFVSWAF